MFSLQQQNQFQFQPQQQQQLFRPPNPNWGAANPALTLLNSANQEGVELNAANSKPLLLASNNKLPSADFEIVQLVLANGPKWGFRIKQLNDNRIIVSRLDKGPADKGGLQVYDEILSVNNVELCDSPQSLLLHDYKTTTASAEQTSGERTPLLPLSPHLANLEAKQEATYGTAGGRNPVELSKLDFAYQLIRHSSASNKLMLVVKRFLNAAYARASVLAASQSSWATDTLKSVDSRQQQDSTTTMTRAFQNQFNRVPQEQQQQQLHAKQTRPQSAIGYAYKCCDCYCENEGKFTDLTCLCVCANEV